MELGMALRHVILLIPLAFAATAMGADSEDRTYPLDEVPACMERGENAAADSCVLKGIGKSNQMIPPNIDDTNEPAAGAPVMRPAEMPMSPTATVNVILHSLFRGRAGSRMSLPADFPRAA
jgi:hypothetical protein